MSAIFAQRLIGTLTFLDVIYLRVHRMLKSRHIKDCCAQSWSMVDQFGTPPPPPPPPSIPLQEGNRNLDFLRRNLSACPQDAKESAYKGLVSPVLEYGRSVWDPPSPPPAPSLPLQEELEKVQKKAARFATGNCIYETGSKTGILEQLYH